MRAKTPAREGMQLPSPNAVRGAMIGVLGLLAITIGWWALALWPVGGVPPAWLERARAVCFNTGPSGLPDASGWLLLIGQPIGMLAVLMVIAGDAVRAGVRRAFASSAGLLGVAGVVGVLLAGWCWRPYGLRMRPATPSGWPRPTRGCLPPIRAWTVRFRRSRAWSTSAATRSTGSVSREARHSSPSVSDTAQRYAP